MDPLKNRYELYLCREGLAEPVPIPEEAYQIIVFKDGLEDFHSENFVQPQNSWNW